MNAFRQGIYQVKNKEKYLGEKNPRYLSSYELTVFRFFDNNPNVIKWGAELVKIPYYDPVLEKNRRYLVDVYVKYRNRKGQELEELVEIKPLNQVSTPKKSKRKKDSTYLQECRTYTTNQAKWQAARDYAKKRKMNFRILTEKEIYKC